MPPLIAGPKVSLRRVSGAGIRRDYSGSVPSAF